MMRGFIPLQARIGVKNQSFSGHCRCGPVMAGQLARLAALTGDNIAQGFGAFSFDCSAPAGAFDARPHAQTPFPIWLLPNRTP